ncbi:hypothetical protein BZB76_0654 [Actinomadura pelletieri DSM 43383]|uniref:Prevent-host-death family protein n=1 Tax=Actinomadura pelletieri DSM 43383 TaxID=1120940 RepID=A0A495QZC0_9ACTN|nr:hypothetical protein BZB76_0654 [Actinomadura pelletieri DSM 43383]
MLVGFGRLVGRVEETGERVRVSDGGEPVGVLLAAAELAELEHYAQRGGYRRPRVKAARGSPVGPEQQSAYVRYVHGDGVRSTYTRGRVVVAEFRPVEEIDWLEECARVGRRKLVLSDQDEDACSGDHRMSPGQAAAFEKFLVRQPPIGDGIAWIADGWKNQEPFTVLEFIKGVAAEDAALAYGADALDVRDGLTLEQVWERDKREGTEDVYKVLAFGEEGGWTWLGYHDTDYAFSRVLDPAPAQEVTLMAIMAKAIYTFSYFKDGEYQNPYPLEDGAVARDMYELIWYTPGEEPFEPDAPLAFLNTYIRGAEEGTDWEDGVSLFFAGLERAFGLSLPQDAIMSGRVRCARPARR